MDIEPPPKYAWGADGISKKDLAALENKAAVLASAQMKLQQAFIQWYSDLKNTPVVGAMFAIHGVPHRVLYHDDRCPGYFLVTQQYSLPTSASFLASQIYYHPPTAEIANGIMTTGVAPFSFGALIEEFLRDMPEAREWTTILKTGPTLPGGAIAEMLRNLSRFGPR